MVQEHLDYLLGSIEKAEGYTYSRNGGGNRIDLWCRQRARRRTTQPCDEENNEASVHTGSVKRRRIGKRLMDCGGSGCMKLADTTTGSSKRGIISWLIVNNDIIHEREGDRFDLSQSQIKCIEERTVEGHAPAHIVQYLKGSGACTVHPDRVYYQWRKVITKLYQRHKDPLESMINLLQSCKNMAECFRGNHPFCLGVITGLGEELIARHGCEEVFIDSTYRTNSEKLEIFSIMTSFAGTGFPISYFFLKPGTEPLSRKRAICEYFKALHNRLSRLRPLLFFTDKDVGQIDAIEEVFGIRATLCVWHMKRAVKKHIGLLKKNNVDVLYRAEEILLLDKISRHYNEHPSLCRGKSASVITGESQAEIEHLLSERRHEPLRTYLLSNWYNNQSMINWGRRNGTKGIPFARTTMFVESHWSILKRTFLKFHNRPRPDFLLFLFDRRLIPKFKSDYDMIVEGAKNRAGTNGL